MLVANFTTRRPGMSDTYTYEDFHKFLGDRPARLGVVSSMYKQNTATYLTEALRNIVYMDHRSSDKYRSIDTPYFEWQIDVNNIKRIQFADVPTETGENGGEITMAFTERYYEKFDIFKIDGSMQQCIVLSRPIRKADNYWEVTVKLIDNDYKSSLDFDSCQIGMTTRFQSNAFPELHEEGYLKYQSDVQKHRGYITTHRVDCDWSSLYGATEDVFLQIARGEGNGRGKEVLYKMNKKEKDLFDNFMNVRNQGLLFNKTSVDVNGKSTLCEPDTGRPIFIGDGVIPQIERYASKYAFANLSVDVFQTMLSMLNEKAEGPIGNKYAFVCNERMWQLVQRNLSDFLFKTGGSIISDTMFWSKEKNGYVNVGATFQSYNFAGNTVSFMVDRAMTWEYGTEKAYAFCLNLTADSTGTEAPIWVNTWGRSAA